jgi:hypothetical protein
MLSSRVFHLNHNVSFLANQPDDPTDSILRHSVGVIPQAVSRLPIRMAAKPFPHGHKFVWTLKLQRLMNRSM